MNLDFLRGTNEFNGLLKAIKGGQKRISLSGVVEPAKPYLLALLAYHLDIPIVFIRPSTSALFTFEDQCRFFINQLSSQASGSRQKFLPEVMSFPQLTESPYQEVPAPLKSISARMRYLFSLLYNPPALTISTLPGLLKSIPNRMNLLRSFAEVKLGDKLDRDYFLQSLVEFGYIRQDLINSHGEYAFRGGIVDVFSPWAERPSRIEFRGDKVSSIREFDSSNQRSSGRVESLLIPALHEFPGTEDFYGEWERQALERAPRQFLNDIEAKFESLSHRDIFPSFSFLSLLDEEQFVSFDHYLDEVAYIIDDPDAVENEWDEIVEDYDEQYSELIEDFKFALPVNAVFPSVLWKEIEGKAVRINDLLPAENVPITFDMGFQSVPRFDNKIPFFMEFIRKRLEGREFCSVFFTKEGVRRKVAALFGQEEILFKETNDPLEIPSEPAVQLLLGEMARGFSHPLSRLHYFAERDIFTEEKVLVRRPRIKPFTSHFQDLQAGDFIVHTDYGIGIFKGLIKMDVEELVREFMQLEYQDEDKLFVPVEDLNLVQKYAKVGTTEPVLNKLGSPLWERTKARTKKAIEELAKELLHLYAKRRALKGHAFSSGGEWLEDFGKTFEFEETDDQLMAINEIIQDMGSASPMDRLLVGDVGYGKTEVAMRAAFRAVMDGMQVAVLCPTTVLASQHMKTFRSRMLLFPVRVESITRFQTKAQQAKIVDDLKKGLVDIIIGTHRLLSEDVGFHNLGLLVVDEEQRFGVKHKEKLKHLRANIDVLTLTATPIPRTLNMSLSGLQDISLIETPPKDRLAIHTVVTQFGRNLVTKAIKRELARGGQVYFVHNRVDDISTIAEKLTQWVPEARVVYIHGQMPGKELEKRMVGFIRQEYNVLVSTTIIENGIDIPLVNTLIVNRADRFGLAQLYQLRGRVGRSSRQAVAYFLVPSVTEMTPLAKMRLKALKEFSELGSGFRLAAKDLEIRGAGSFLGSRQHGNMEAVGFDYYMHLLDRTVRELKGEDVEEVKTEINLKVDVKIPETFLPQINLRLNLYKRISSAENIEEIEQIRQEIEDRYGLLPESVGNLLRYGIVKFLAHRLKIKGIDRIGPKIVFDFYPGSRADLSRLPPLLNKYRGTMTPQGVMSLSLSSEGEGNILDETIFILKELSDM
ncbi:transcription-repair coupling factor [Acidobacteriota bacterium]